ncbi:MAG TPA: GDYXXLXY domain-containing protein [Usitatibacter sp.]|nr:GDYXXLXY domain-containing protein [Usitatibacter sp.]
MSVTRALILAGVALVLGAVDASILAKERVKRDGEVVFLELAPVDPRSLVQGDYMALDFLIARQLAGGAPAPGGEGNAALVLDERRVARLAPAGSAPDLRIHYRIRNGRPWIGTNAYFFQEGAGARYQGARFGEFRVDRGSGEAVLVGLRDKALKSLE